MDLIKEITHKEDAPKIVVRVRTYAYHDRKGIHIQKDLNIMKRMSRGFDFLTEDCNMIGADEVVPHIVNLHSVKDGLYHFMITNVKRDWETGYVDSYDYELVPVATEQPSIPS